MDILVYIAFILLIVAAIWYCISLGRQAKEGCTFLDIKLNRAASEMLSELAKWRNTSQVQALRDGMVLIHWCEEQKQAGKYVQIKVKDRSQEESGHAKEIADARSATKLENKP